MNITLNINGNINNYCGAKLLSVEKRQGNILLWKR